MPPLDNGLHNLRVEKKQDPHRKFGISELTHILIGNKVQVQIPSKKTQGSRSKVQEEHIPEDYDRVFLNQRLSFADGHGAHFLTRCKRSTLLAPRTSADCANRSARSRRNWRQLRND